jgi:hypothetical protein
MFYRMRKRALVILALAPFACTFDGLDAYTSGSEATTGDGGDAAKDAAGDGAFDAAKDATDATPPPCNLSAPFGTPTPVGALNTTMIDTGAALSPDELTVFFLSNRLNQGSNVFTASRPNTSTSFGAVAALTSLNFSGADTWNVTLTADGLTAYLVTDQNAADHMYKATRASSLASFGTPTKMPSPVVEGEQPFVLPNGSALYYSDTVIATKGQIVRATIGGSITTAVQSSLVVGTHDIGIPVLDPTETTIYYSVYDAGNFGSYDIWMATRATPTDAWSTPTAVTELNSTTDFEAPSWLSADKCELYYTRAATGSDWDVYVARRP